MRALKFVLFESRKAISAGNAGINKLNAYKFLIRTLRETVDLILLLKTFPLSVRPLTTEPLHVFPQLLLLLLLLLLSSCYMAVLNFILWLS
jgi:hypothetical protein